MLLRLNERKSSDVVTVALDSKYELSELIEIIDDAIEARLPFRVALDTGTTSEVDPEKYAMLAVMLESAL